MKINKNLFYALISSAIVQMSAQENPLNLVAKGGEYPLQTADAQHPCLTETQYSQLEQEIIQNCKDLQIEEVSKKGGMVTSFSWPLKAASGFPDCDYYIIGNYVDQDPTTGIQDYNCGTVTYNGHKGMDIGTFPYGFYKMDNNQVEIIAAAAGTIVARVDGNFDKNCAMNNLTSNYVAVLHADGSRAFYLHMKKNSVTTKTIGQTVATGEFLGLVGSSGSSTGPHLHFEVWANSSSNSVIDPYTGTCNVINSNTWWAAQKTYREPAVLSVQVNTQLAQFPACPATEIPNGLNCVAPNVPTHFYIHLRNETIGLQKNLKILGPNTATYTTWNAGSTTNYIGSNWYWTFNSPSTPGTYTFVVTYNGTTCSKVFQVGCSAVGMKDINSSLSDLKVISTGGKLQLNYEGLENSATKVTLINASGRIVLKDQFFQDGATYNRNIQCDGIANGIYFLSSETSKGIIVRKIIIQQE